MSNVPLHSIYSQTIQIMEYNVKIKTYMSSYCLPPTTPNTQQTNATCNTHPYIHANTPNNLHLIQDIKTHIKEIT